MESIKIFESENGYAEIVEWNPEMRVIDGEPQFTKPMTVEIHAKDDESLEKLEAEVEEHLKRKGLLRTEATS